MIRMIWMGTTMVVVKRGSADCCQLLPVRASNVLIVYNCIIETSLLLCMFEERRYRSRASPLLLRVKAVK